MRPGALFGVGYQGEKALYRYTNYLFFVRHHNAGDIAVAGKFFIALHIFGYFLARMMRRDSPKHTVAGL
jgi:hypothetical protein